MKKRLLLVFIFLGFIYISYTVGHTLGSRQSNDVAIKGANKVHSLAIAYSAALSLKAEMDNHTFIKSGNKLVAEQFSLDRIDIVINQIEAIDYKGSPFEAGINQNLSAAKEYVKNARHQANDVNNKEN